MARIDTTNYYNPDVGKDTVDFPTVMNRYLWNSDTQPDPSVLESRNWDVSEWKDGPRDTVVLDTSAHMATGPGRFVSAVDFPFFQKFFDGGHNLSPGVYTFHGNNGSTELPTSVKDELIKYDYTAGGAPKLLNQLSIPISQYPLSLGPDFITRAFVFGSEQYEVPATVIEKQLVLVVNADGTKEVRGLQIVPAMDNFDFESSSTVAKLANAILEPELDPMNQGKTVYM